MLYLGLGILVNFICLYFNGGQICNSRAINKNHVSSFFCLIKVKRKISRFILSSAFDVLKTNALSFKLRFWKNYWKISQKRMALSLLKCYIFKIIGHFLIIASKWKGKLCAGIINTTLYCVLFQLSNRKYRFFKKFFIISFFISAGLANTFKEWHCLI
jgi:hypothetical protein